MRHLLLRCVDPHLGLWIANHIAPCTGGVWRVSAEQPNLASSSVLLFQKLWTLVRSARSVLRQRECYAGYLPLCYFICMLPSLGVYKYTPVIHIYLYITISNATKEHYCRVNFVSTEETLRSFPVAKTGFNETVY